MRLSLRLKLTILSIVLAIITLITMYFCLPLVEKFAFFLTLDPLLTFMIAFAITICFIALVSNLVLKYLVCNPLQKLKSSLHELEHGNFIIDANVFTGDELQDLARSITHTADALKDVHEERAQLDNAKTQFISITSHELRSPMTPMKAQLQMLIQGYSGKLTKKQKESLDIVLRNTERLDNIIVDFLEISRIEAARLKFKFSKTDLVEHIERLVKEMKGFMPEKHIDIVTSIDSLPIIEIDPDRVMQVLRNIINNAIKFSIEKSTIYVAVKLLKDTIQFSVKNTGVVIDQENQRRIFEPFFQEEQSMYRKFQGTGLGLTICRGIVESQGGKLSVYSENSETIFTFSFPLRPVTEIRPIKLMFSKEYYIDNRIADIFSNYLGPLGDSEFKTLKRTGITYDSLQEYVRSIGTQHILDKDTLSKMSADIKAVFASK